MTTTSPARTDAGTAADTARQIIVLVSSILAIVAAFIGSGAIIGTPVQEAAGGYLNSDSTLIAPGTGAFVRHVLALTIAVALAAYLYKRRIFIRV